MSIVVLILFVLAAVITTVGTISVSVLTWRAERADLAREWTL